MSKGFWSAQRSPGQMQEVTTARQRHMRSRLENLILERGAKREHLWIAIVGHLMQPPFTGPLVLDLDTVLSPPLTSCYLCELEYEPGLEATPCAGDPDLIRHKAGR